MRPLWRNNIPYLNIIVLFVAILDIFHFSIIMEKMDYSDTSQKSISRLCDTDIAFYPVYQDSFQTILGLLLAMARVYVKVNSTKC